MSDIAPLNESSLLRAKVFSPQLLILISIILRGVIYFFSLYPNEIQSVSPTDRLYYEALRYHFFEYLWYTTNIPPVTHIINAIVFVFFKPEIAYGKFIFLIVTFILDILSLFLLFSASCKFGITRKVSFFLALFYSFTIIPFEVWRFGSLYDHHSLFFTSLYIYAISLFYSDKRLRSAALMSLAGGLMIAQSSISSVVVPMTSLFIVVLLNIKLKGKDLIKRIGIVLIGPVAILLLISTKNYMVADTFATSTKSGPAMMMFVRRALGRDNVRIEKLLREAGAPGWYIDCFNSAVIPPDLKPENPNFKGWLNLSRDFGICFPWTNIEADTWPYDFGPLLALIRKYNEPYIERKIIEDIDDMHKRKYLFAGYSPELSPRWIGIYGSISMQMGKWLLLHKPFTYFKNALRTQGLFFVRGTSFFRITLYTNKKPHSLSTLSSPIHGEMLFYVVTTIFEWAARVIYILMFAYAALISWKIVRNLINNRAYRLPHDYHVFLIMALPAILLSLMFSMTADVENDRYFVQITPYLVLCAGYFASAFIEKIRVKHLFT